MILSLPDFDKKTKIYCSIDLFFSLTYFTLVTLKISTFKFISTFSFKYNLEEKKITTNKKFVTLITFVIIIFSLAFTYICYIELKRINICIALIATESLIIILSITLMIKMQQYLLNSFNENNKIITFQYKKHNFNNTYLIKSNESNAILVDCGGDLNSVINYCLLNNLTITHLFITHFHFDHIKNVKELYKYNEKIILCINEKTNSYFFGGNNEFEIQTYIKEKANIDSFPQYEVKIFKNKEEICINEITVTTLLFGGHTPDTSFFYIKEYNSLFVGDTLFKNGIGMHHFEYTDMKKFEKSINYIKEQNLDLEIYPGHYEQYNVSEIKDVNINNFLSKD